MMEDQALTAAPTLWKLFRRFLTRLWTPAVPYRIGDCVVADDPFVGRTEGIVETKHGSLVGLRTATEDLVFCDHREVRRVE
jgi:hypothetical protein